MSTILVNNVKSYTGDTVTISGSNILVHGKTTLGDGSGTDTLKVRADLSLSGSAQVSGNIMPAGDDIHNLGSSVKQWKDLHLDGTAFIDFLGTAADPVHTASFAYISSSLIPSVDDQVDLGLGHMQWKDLFIDGVAKIDALGSVAGDTAIAYIAHLSGSGNINLGNAAITSSVNIVPGVDNRFSLGSSVKEWKNLFIDGVAKIDALGSVAGDTAIAYIAHLSGSGQNGQRAITSSVDIVPGVDNKFNLGSSVKEWKDLFIDGVAKIDALGSAAGDTSIAYIAHLSGSGLISAGPASITASVNIVPFRDDIYSLGSAEKQWKDLFIDGTAYIDAFDGTSGNFAGDITGSNISASGTVFANALSLNPTQADTADAAFYIVHGSKVEVRNQLQAAIADGTFGKLELRNTSIATDSIVLGSFTGTTSGNITGSIITAATTAASTASIQIHNETGFAIGDDTSFTASFVVL